MIIAASKKIQEKEQQKKSPKLEGKVSKFITFPEEFAKWLKEQKGINGRRKRRNKEEMQEEKEQKQKKREEKQRKREEKKEEKKHKKQTLKSFQFFKQTYEQRVEDLKKKANFFWN